MNGKAKPTGFETQNFERILSTDQRWFLALRPFLHEYFFDYNGNSEQKSPQWLRTRQNFVYLVEDLLRRQKIAVAADGPNIDRERQSIDTIVVHHSATSDPANYRLSYLDAMMLIRLYASVHSDPKAAEYQRPIWSNHFYRGHQTFIGYHWVVFPDGKTYHVLADNTIGWQAGNWALNCRSVAICLVGDYSKQKPPTNMLQKAQQIVVKYPQTKLLGHHDINAATSCPGKPFYGPIGWQQALVQA